MDVVVNAAAYLKGLLVATVAATPGYYERYNDLRFEEVQENWVVDQLPPTSRKLDGAFGRRQVTLLRMLGSDNYDYRQVALEDLEREIDDPGTFRLLVWGTRHRDPEIVDACDRLLNKIFECRACDGRGWLIYEQVEDMGTVIYTGPTPPTPCHACDSTGNVRCGAFRDRTAPWRRGKRPAPGPVPGRGRARTF